MLSEYCAKRQPVRHFYGGILSTFSNELEETSQFLIDTFDAFFVSQTATATCGKALISVFSFAFRDRETWYYRMSTICTFEHCANYTLLICWVSEKNFIFSDEDQNGKLINYSFILHSLRRLMRFFSFSIWPYGPIWTFFPEEMTNIFFDIISSPDVLDVILET